MMWTIPRSLFESLSKKIVEDNLKKNLSGTICLKSKNFDYVLVLIYYLF